MMNLEEYKDAFTLKAASKGFTEEQIEQCLTYASIIISNGCPVIYDGKQLSFLVGYKYEYIRKAIFGTELHYKTYTIPKKNGGHRTISEPLPSLKEIQYWILNNILYHLPVHPYAKAYIKGKKIKENLRFHKRQRIVLTLDIHDFFGSITRQHVRHIFKEIGYSSKLSSILSHLVCLDEKLPQGAPTSPCLSNIYV